MTATRDLLDDLVEDETYLLGTSWEYPDGSGGVRWELKRYQQPGPEVLRTPGVDGPMWCQVETWTTAPPPNGHYGESAMSRLRELGYDPGAMDLRLILPDGNERLRPGG